MKVLLFIALLSTVFYCKAQSTLDVQAGWTYSKVRVLYDKSKYNLGPVGHEWINLRPLNLPFMGVNYTYQLDNIHLKTGLFLMVYGSRDTPSAPDYIWHTSYLTLPLITGYRVKLVKTKPLFLKWNIGIDLGYRLEKNLAGHDLWWGNINIISGLELNWKRFSLGVSGYWGMNDFFEYYPFNYRHTGLTTYLSYTFWNSQKAKAKRLERQQAKQLTE